ncbi:uncharacterized protein LOC124315642 [Daphnia pulicaria]|uniref:uncharacterized protein LOC124315642 n=1 Tax=Daphnia pulicaria TaxID=35523 RepID=UPI001EEBDA54|nr:uncharacterized protein LOC124315642 [Daphnia pulicaria]
MSFTRTNAGEPLIHDLLRPWFLASPVLQLYPNENRESLKKTKHRSCYFYNYQSEKMADRWIPPRQTIQNSSFKHVKEGSDGLCRCFEVSLVFAQLKHWAITHLHYYSWHVSRQHLLPASCILLELLDELCELRFLATRHFRFSVLKNNKNKTVMNQFLAE